MTYGEQLALAFDIFADCLREAGDDVEMGLLAAEHILTSDDPHLSHGPTPSPAPLTPLIEEPTETPSPEAASTWTKDTYPRDRSGRFVDKHDLVDAANDEETSTRLRESIPEDQHWRLDRAISLLQGGGTVHHPSEPPGMAVNLSGRVEDDQWASYSWLLKMYEEWGERHEDRKHCKSCLRSAVRNLRSQTTQDLNHIDDLLRQANIDDRGRRSIRRARYRYNKERITKDQLEDIYENIIERMLRKIEDAEESDREMEEPKAPGDHTHQTSPASLAMSDALPTPTSAGQPRVQRRYGPKPGPGWHQAGTSRFGTPVWVWGPSQAGKAAQPATEPSPPPNALQPPTGPQSSFMPPTPPSQSIVDGTPPPIELPPPVREGTAKREEDLVIDESQTVREQQTPGPDDGPESLTARSMATEPFLTQEPLGGGANGSYRVKIGAIDGVWKPSNEEDILRFGVRQGSYYRREAAAHSIAKIIGIPHLVPLTVERRQGNTVGSVQQWVPDAKVAADFDDDDPRIYDGEDDHKLATAFDYLIGNTDRHDGNWMIDKDGKLHLIDNGLAFPYNNHDKFRSYLFNTAARTSLKVPEAVNSWDGDKIANELKKHNIEQEAIDGVLKRLKDLKLAASAGAKFANIQDPRSVAELQKKIEIAKIPTGE